MKVNYSIIEYRRDREWITVEFTHPDWPDKPWVRQFSFPDFSKEKLTEQLMAMASGVAGSWTRAPDHPAELPIPASGQLDVEPELYLPYEPNPQYEEEPEIDPWTQELLPGDITSDTQETIPWVVRELSQDEQQERVDSVAEAHRQERNFMLLQSDHIFCTDVEVDNKDEWVNYRQALRDMPSQPNFPKEFEWPISPKEDQDDN